MLSLSVTSVYSPARVIPAAAPRPIERRPAVLLYSKPVAVAAKNVLVVSSLSLNHVIPNAMVEYIEANIPRVQPVVVPVNEIQKYIAHFRFKIVK